MAADDVTDQPARTPDSGGAGGGAPSVVSAAVPSERPAPGSPTLDGDWASQLTARVEDVVSVIRDKTVLPVEKAVRYVIFGLLAAVISVLLVSLICVAMLRILTTEVPYFIHHVWAAYLVLAGIFWVAGLLLLRLRRPRTK